jgi:hypothetical protein
MTVAEFRVSDGTGFSGALLALWWDARGDWEKAHEVAQNVAMLIFIARRGIWGMRLIGTGRRGEQLRRRIRVWSGRGLCGSCWGGELGRCPHLRIEMWGARFFGDLFVGYLRR